VVSPFGLWSACETTVIDSLCTSTTRTCGSGLSTRTRTIVTQPQGNGAVCPALSEQATCVTQCSVNCVEGVWSQWSTCSSMCGSGKQSRTRTISVEAQFCGRACGATSEEQTCNAQTCAPNVAPVDCVVSAHVVSAPDRCSVPACGGGTVTARATVLTPAQGNGKACPSLELVQQCNSAQCPMVLESGMRWRIVSSDNFESFVWTSFRSKLAHYLVVDENRLQLNSVMSGSTIVELTLFDAAGDPARNHAGRLTALATEATSGLNVVSTSEVAETSAPTTRVAIEMAPAELSESTTTIIIAVAASAGGLLLIGSIVACIVVANKKKKERAALESATMLATWDTPPKASAPTEPAAAMQKSSSYEPAVEASSLRKTDNDKPAKRASTYESAVDASSLRRSDPVVDDKKHYEELYDAKNASYTKAPRAKKHHKSKDKSKDKPTDSPPAGSHGSLVRKSKSSTSDVLHIPLEEVELGKKLGEGAFGVVYKGKWHGKSVAVKQVKAGAIGGDKAMAEFEAEIGNMAKVSFHENLVQLYGVTTLENGDLAAVVEFCANGALVAALYGDKARTDWTLDALMRIAHGAACGVAHLHRQDMVHRDIAARNVLLTKSDEPKVADFGMARLVSDDVYEHQTMNAIGPLKWMAPEQLERRAYSKASDVFAFGVLLFEIFKQEEPWKGVYSIDVAVKVRSGERLDVSSRKIPREIAALMTDCWAAAKKERPSMEQVQRVLHDNLLDDYSSSSVTRS
jgi:hypothetical protein